MAKVRIGTAGWTIPPQLKAEFPETGTHLEKYATRFNCVEINSSFYRDHKPETYVKWAQVTPADFRFSVKLNRYFLQTKRLRETGSLLKATLQGIQGLKEKLGVLLIQLPPSLSFDEAVAKSFLSDLRKLYQGPVVWEPRHRSWVASNAVRLLSDFHVNKVLADPEPCRLPKDLRPSVEQIRYFRLHGSPEIYKSRYTPEVIERISRALRHPLSPARESWIIFDNTTYGFATENALELSQAVSVL